MPVAVSPAQLKHHVEVISNKYFPRNFEHPEILEQVAHSIAANFRAMGLKTIEQPFRAWGRLYKNLLVRFGPAAKRRIVVGAHYDACGEQPGADDNASGVAGLIELARLLTQVEPATPVELVAYSLEEPPHFSGQAMGSAFHARELRKERIEVTAMISLEMIGFFSDQPGSQLFPSPWLRFFYPSVGNFIAVVGDLRNHGLVRSIRKSMRAARSIPVYSLSAPSFIPGIDLSDHVSYWRQGYRAAMITDTAFYRNTAYHSGGDTADRLDYERMAGVVQGVFRAVIDLAETQRTRRSARAFRSA